MSRYQWYSLVSLLALCAQVLSVPHVKVGNTTIIGSLFPNSTDVEFFGRIPYAEPPLGPLRFAPSIVKNIDGWQTQTINATQFGPYCPQYPALFPVEQDEDCLQVNIFRPAGTDPKAALPVMLWIYGGGYVQGGGPFYNGSRLIDHSVARGTPIMLVTMNYRLGLLGMPMGNEVKARGSLNLGIKDAVTTMQWIRNNIGFFGGNPEKVTAFGESAGAMTIAILFLNQNPPLHTLASGAIIESGAPDTGNYVTDSDAETYWQRFVSAVPECKGAQTNQTFDCLRQANLSTINDATTFSIGNNSFVGLNPSVEGTGGVFPDYPSRLYRQGKFAKIPFISGNNLDEGPELVVDPSIHTDEAVRECAIGNLSLTCYPKDVQDRVASKILQLYPNIPALGSPYGTGNETFGLDPEFKREAAILGDIMFHAPRRAFMRALVGSGAKAFSYLLTDAPKRLVPAYWGVAHGQDEEYFFEEHGSFLADPVRQATVNLRNDMIDYWISFAVNQDPNDGHGNTKRLHWPQWEVRNPTMVQLDGLNTTLIPDTYRREQIDYLVSEVASLQKDGVPTC